MTSTANARQPLRAGCCRDSSDRQCAFRMVCDSQSTVRSWATSLGQSLPFGHLFLLLSRIPQYRVTDVSVLAHALREDSECDR